MGWAETVSKQSGRAPGHRVTGLVVVSRCSLTGFSEPESNGSGTKMGQEGKHSSGIERRDWKETVLDGPPRP